MSDRDITAEVEAFLRERASLQVTHAHQWVVFADRRFQGAFDRYEGAARFAVTNFGDAPFLVRNVDDHEEHVPLIFADSD